MSLPSVDLQTVLTSFHHPALSCSSSLRFSMAHLRSPKPRSFPVQRPEHKRRWALVVAPTSAGAGSATASGVGAAIALAARKRMAWNFIFVVLVPYGSVLIERDLGMDFKGDEELISD